MLVFATLVLSVDVDRQPDRDALPGGRRGRRGRRVPHRRPEPDARALRAAWPTAWRSRSIGLVVRRILESTRQLLLLSLAHWLVYLQLIKMFLPKTVEDDWFLFLLGLMQVLVGGGRSARATRSGSALFAWALLALWVLGLFSLQREALRLPAACPGRRRSVGDDRRSPIPGLLDLPFLFAALRVAATTLALGGVIFLAMPRRSSMARTARAATCRPAPDRLRRRGPARPARRDPRERQRRDERRALRRRTASRIAPPRRAALAGRDDGRLRQGPLAPAAADRDHAASRRTPPTAAGRRTAHPPADQARSRPTPPILFGLRPMLDADGRSGAHPPPELNAVDGTIFRDRSPDRARTTTRSLVRPDPDAAPARRAAPDAATRMTMLLVRSPQPIREPRSGRSPSAVVDEDPRRRTPRRPAAAGAGSVPPRFGRVRLHAPAGRGRPDARPGRRLPGQPQGGALRVLRQRADAPAPLDRHPRADGQRLQGGRLERPGPGDERAPEARP